MILVKFEIYLFINDPKYSYSCCSRSATNSTRIQTRTKRLETYTLIAREETLKLVWYDSNERQWGVRPYKYKYISLYRCPEQWWLSN